jgi:hypothetical protein
MEVTVLRIIRIALLALVPTIALGTLVTACSDDTTNNSTVDKTATSRDMATAHDMVATHD